jgi:hypothetical protein
VDAAMLLMKTTSERSCARRRGRAALASWCGPTACTASSHRTSSALVPATGCPRLATPALLTTMPSEPNSATAAATARSLASGSSMLASTARAEAPLSVSVSTSASAAARSRR